MTFSVEIVNLNTENIAKHLVLIKLIEPIADLPL